MKILFRNISLGLLVGVLLASLVVGIPTARALVQSSFGALDGIVSAPAFYFHNDTNNGLYRIGADNWALSGGGVSVLQFTASTVTIPSGINFASAGTLRLADGSVTAPALAFTTDTDLGFWRVAANELGVVATTVSFPTDVNHVIQVTTQDTAATAGSNLTVRAAVGNTSGAGGTLAVVGGAGGATGAGGPATFTGGAAGGGATDGGAITLAGGAGATTGDGGAVSIAGGIDGATGGTGGAVTIQGGEGDTDGTLTLGGTSTLSVEVSSALNVGAVASTFDGAVTLGDTSGDAITITGSISSGLTFTAGSARTIAPAQAADDTAGDAVSLTAGQGGAGVAGGAGAALNLTAGAGTDGTGDSVGGALVLAGGAAADASAGDGGSVTITAGASTAGAPGRVIIGPTAAGQNRGFLVLHGGAGETTMPVAGDLRDPGAVAGASIALVVGDNGSDACIIFIGNDAGTISAASLIIDGSGVTWVAGATTPLDCAPGS